MAVAFDTFARNNGSGTSITVSMTLGSSANLLICFVAIDAPVNFNPTATWNGVSMGAVVNEVFTGRYLAWFKLVNPDTGTHDLVVSLPGGGAEQVMGISFSGVDTTTPTDAAQSASASSGSDVVTLTNSSATGDMVVSCSVNNGSTAPTVDSANDDPAMSTPTNGSFDNASFSSIVNYQAGQASVVTSWANLAGSQSAFAININAAATSTTLAVDAASFDIDGQAIPLNVGIVVGKADLQPAGQDITLAWTQNWFLPVDAAAFQIDGQDITLAWTQNWSLAVDNASFDIDGQDVTLAWTQNWFLEVDKADLQPAGQDISLIWSASLDIAVDSAAFSLSGSAVDLTLTTSAAEAPSGGWVESATDIRIARERARLRKELEEEQEREELADRLERVLVQEGSLTQAQADLIRLRGVAAKYSRDDLPNRARRALAFAERAQSEFSTRLALREIRRLEEEEEMAVLLLMTLD